MSFSSVKQGTKDLGVTMASIKITPKSREVVAKINILGQTHKENIEQALKDILPEVLKENRRLIRNTQKTGRMYGMHQASAPGEAPANRTGKLVSSGNYGVRNSQQAYIGESIDYAVFLELGTRKMIKRPHLIRAINNKAGYTYTRLMEAGNI